MTTIDATDRYDLPVLIKALWSAGQLWAAANLPERETPDDVVADVKSYYYEAWRHLAVSYRRITGLVNAGKLDKNDAMVLQGDLRDVRDELFGGILYTVLGESELNAIDYYLPGEANSIPAV